MRKKKQTDKMKAVLVGIAGSHNAFSLSLYNLKAYAYQSSEIRVRWAINVIQHPLINVPEREKMLSDLTNKTVELVRRDTLSKENVKLQGLSTIIINILDEIPAEFGNLIRLKYLHLDKNQIKSIPESIGGSQGLKKLERLILNDNQIDSVSVYLGNLTSLTELDLSRNSLETLPNSLCGFSNIIKIVGNQFDCGCVEYESCFSS